MKPKLVQHPGGRPALVYSGTFDGRKFKLVLAKRHYGESYRDYNMKPRLYVDFNESLLENLINRASRPVVQLGRTIRPILAYLELGGTIGWYRHAGCSCSCSPGFIWTDAPGLDFGDGLKRRQYDAQIMLEDAPAVDDSPKANATRRARLDSIAADPTLPLEVLAGTQL